jgi:5-methylcytosine-specific restriction endonuclease McrA
MRQRQAAAPRRKQLRPAERTQVLAKTAGRCHICGGSVEGTPWQADHVLAHNAGGAHSADNYLPAHSLCNNYRWDYSAEEFQWVLKIGVWARLEMEKAGAFGDDLVRRFSDYERRREGRRKAR